MNVQELINRSSPASFSQDEMIFIVKQYIKDKTNHDIDINLFKNLDKDNIMFKISAISQINKLNAAFNTAMDYYIKNK